MSKPLTIIAVITAAPGKESELDQLLRGLLAPTRREAGCINYDMHRVQGDARTFVFHENWASKAHLDAHIKSPHIQAFLAKSHLMASPVNLTFCEKVD